MDLVKHFLLHGTMENVNEAQLTSVCSALKVQVTRHDERRAAVKSKLKFVRARRMFQILFVFARSIQTSCDHMPLVLFLTLRKRPPTFESRVY